MTVQEIAEKYRADELPLHEALNALILEHNIDGDDAMVALGFEPGRGQRD